MSSRVVLVEPVTKFDLSEAERYGTLTTLSPNLLNPFDVSGAARMMSHALDHMEFNPDEDYLCLTGNTLTVSVMVAVASQKYRRFQMLMFDARRSEYKMQTFSPARFATA